METILTVLYDNNRFDPRLKPAWGKGCPFRNSDNENIYPFWKLDPFKGPNLAATGKEIMINA
jgi:hypothetical protein